jgi:CheY-like chemotaxis protein
MTAPVMDFVMPEMDGLEAARHDPQLIRPCNWK